MLRHSPLWQLSLAKMREMLREPEALFWVFVFPILLALALGIAFRSRGDQELAVGVQPGDAALVETLQRAPGLRAVELEPGRSREELRAGRVALVVIPGDPLTYWFDPVREEGRMARLAVDQAVQSAAGRIEAVTVTQREMTERGSRYIDFLIPGLLGMNLMGTGLWGIGFNIVQARSRYLLKRLVATPMRRAHFLLGQIGGRLAFLVLEVGVLVAFANLVFDVPVRGSLLSIGAIAVLGAMTFAGLGLLVASRAQTLEGIAGLVNLVMLPMWIMSGIFFSTSRFPEAMQPLVQVLPLTAVNDALRGVMIDGLSLVAVSGELLIAAAWGLVCFVAALAVFRWR